HARTPEQLLERLGGWVDLVHEVRQAPNGAAALMTIWRYILAVNERGKPEEVLARLAAAVGEAGKEEIVTIADQLREEGRKEGHKAGRQEGRCEMLLKLL